MTLLICALAGLAAGILLNWAEDYMPRWATQRIEMPPPRWQFALGRLLPASLSRTPGLPSGSSLWRAAGVEAVTAALFVYLGARLGLSSDLWIQAAMVSFLILVALIDLKYHLVLNVMVLPAFVLVLWMHWVTPGTNWLAVFIGAFFGWGIFAAVARLRPGELGSGDVKLATLIGLGLGFPNVLGALLIAVFAGGLGVVILVVKRGANLKSQMPYAPFLSLGAIAMLVYLW
jgi:prepilin signal peptidase PulO-like enzyme (type II secretory pathway)